MPSNCWTVLKKDRTFMCNAVFAMNSAALSSRGLRKKGHFLWKLRFFLASVYKIWKWKFWFHVKIKWSWMLSYSISLLEGKKYVCLTPHAIFWTTPNQTLALEIFWVVHSATKLWNIFSALVIFKKSDNWNIKWDMIWKGNTWTTQFCFQKLSNSFELWAVSRQSEHP